MTLPQSDSSMAWHGSVSPTGSRCRCALLLGWLLCVSLLVLPGCHYLNRSGKQVSLPSKHSVRSDQLLVSSDFRISSDHALIQNLKDLRQQVYQHLELPVQQRSVNVYLFNDETSYRKYLAQMYPGLPHRRAYFFKTVKELAVFTYWGDRIQEDLRHEFTHGLLHASLTTVPLWLDEGLAEYFEVTGSRPGELNSNYPSELTAKIGDGWKPDLKRLEDLEEFANLERLDYQESWAWVHFMLHHTPETREALLGYLRDLRTTTKPYPLSNRLQVAQTDFDHRFLSYVASLNTFSDTMQSTSQVSEERENPFDREQKFSRIVEETGLVTLASAQESAVTSPDYQLELPQHVTPRMMITGQEGHVKLADGPTIYTTAHRHGWDDLLRLFVEGDIALDDAEGVKAFAENPSTEYWDLAREARTQGIYDCYQALRKSSATTGADLLRKAHR